MPRIEPRPRGAAPPGGAGGVPRPACAPLLRRVAIGTLLICTVAGPGHAGQGAVPAATATPAPAISPDTAIASAAANGSSSGANNAARATAGLRAHAIVYRGTFMGIGAGTLELTLRPGATPGSWVYETRPNPSFLASFAINPKSRERSSFELDAEGRVAPLGYRLDDGTSAHKDNVELAYLRSRGRITGSSRGAAVDLPLEPGTQDVMSIRLATPVDLLAGREPADYPMVDGSELKHFVYRRVGPQRIRTALGELDTIVFTSERKGADARDRTWRYWFAPSLGWLPVRIEQRQEGRTRLEFEVRALRWL